MAINIPTPIVIPPQPSKQADKVWVLTMNVNANRGNEAPTTAYFSVAPYISSTGEILKEQMQHINVSDVFATCQTNPTLAQAVGAIYLAVENLCKQNRLFGMEPDKIIPNIIVQPTATPVLVGENIVLSVTANGKELTYQWKKNGVDLVDDERILGSTTPQLSIFLSELTDGGEYTVTVTNSDGTVTSDIVTLIVSNPTIQSPEITVNPSSVSKTLNETVIFSVVAIGDELTYQWRKDEIDLNDGEKYSGCKTSELSIVNLEENDAGNYTVVVSNTGGSITSDNAALTII